MPREVSRVESDAGYSMVVLLVGIAVMAVLMTAAMPTWRHMAQREREEELIFRGTQYARAIALFQRKYPGAFPPNIQVLLDQKFLRRKYRDPMTADGEFQPLFQNSPGFQGAPGAVSPGSQPGSTSGRPGAAGTPTSPATPPPSTTTGPPGTAAPPGFPAGGQSGALAGPQGGMVGVVSKSRERSIRIFNGRSRYNEWQFDVSLVTRQVAPGGGGGAAQPGQPVTPGGGPTPGTGRPGAPGTTPGGARPPAPGLPRPPG